jgi:hypothetical protein
MIIALNKVEQPGFARPPGSPGRAKPQYNTLQNAWFRKGTPILNPNPPGTCWLPALTITAGLDLLRGCAPYFAPKMRRKA